MNITLTHFERNINKNSWAYSQTLPAIADPSQTYTMSKHMVDALARISDPSISEPEYWNFAEYNGRGSNDRKDIKQSTAIVIEYPKSKEADVLASLADIGLAHWLVQTDKSLNRKLQAASAFIIPAAQPMVNNGSTFYYDRAVCCLLEHIGVEGAYYGVNFPTYLIKPAARQPLQAFAGDLLDVASYIKLTKDWAGKSSLWTHDKEGNLPAPLAVTPSASPVAADADDLFDWGDA